MRSVVRAAAIVWCARAASAGDLTLLAHAPDHPSASPPLIVLLHGAGADERDMIDLWRQIPSDFVVVSPRAPFPDGRGYRWYRPASRATDLAVSRRIVDLVVDAAVARFHADRSRVFLGGFSQGAVVTYDVALAEPTTFRGAVVLSGSMAGTAGTMPATTGRSGPAFFIGHGTVDRRIPFAAALSARATLERRGVQRPAGRYAQRQLRER